MAATKFSYKFYKMIVDSRGIITNGEGDTIADVFCGKGFSIINVFDMVQFHEMTKNFGPKKQKPDYSAKTSTVMNTVTKRLRRIGGFMVRYLEIAGQRIYSYYIPAFTPMSDYETLSKKTEFQMYQLAKEARELYICRSNKYKNPDFYNCIAWGDF
jgi:hypothetical protein